MEIYEPTGYAAAGRLTCGAAQIASVPGQAGYKRH